MGIKTTGLKEEMEKIKKLGSLFDEEIMKEMNDLGLEWRDDARENTDVITGLLRRSFKFEGTNKNGRTILIEVSNNTEYADHYEFGHRVKIHGKYTGGFVKGKYVLRDSRRRAYAQLPSRIRKAIKRAEEKLNG